MCLTTSEYWDCECIEEYIHHKDEPPCLRCGMSREDSPDSHLREVKELLGDCFFCENKRNYEGSDHCYRFTEKPNGECFQFHE